MMAEGITRAVHVPSLSRIRIGRSAEWAFPSAQVSAACGIISIDGLGELDGDYVLVNSADVTLRNKPTWIGTSGNSQKLALSYLPDEKVWAIGANGLIRAFLEIDSGIPSAQSSRWHVFNEESSAFEGIGNIVSISCPGKPCLHVLKN